MTVRQLISHTAGLLDSVEPYGRTDAAALKDYVTSFTPKNAFAPPGTVLSYSNPGFSVAGLVLERVSGMPYIEYMAKHVFPALGMTRTTFDPKVAITYLASEGYQPGKTKLEIVRPTPDNAAQYPAGFAFSSVEDLSQLMLFLLQDGKLSGKSVLSQASVQTMKTPVLKITPLNVGYGLGLFVTQEDGITTIGHGGAINGYTTALETIPSQKFGIVILANKSGFDPTPILDAVRESLVNYPTPTLSGTVWASDFIDRCPLPLRVGGLTQPLSAITGFPP
ncbi:MAG: beta-lactamase family protein, partial [Tolypothrix carrinoi HA7290-LM1]|nr:beta-lactamase family protein [Tolypothrix carrinoi HA7290-LM1]